MPIAGAVPAVSRAAIAAARIAPGPNARLTARGRHIHLARPRGPALAGPSGRDAGVPGVVPRATLPRPRGPARPPRGEERPGSGTGVSDVALARGLAPRRRRPVEKRPDLRRLRVVQLLEYRQRLAPGLPRGRRAAEGTVSLAQVPQRPGLVITVAKRAVQGQRPLVAGERLEVAAKVMAGEADRHPRGGLTAVVAGFLEHGQGLAGAGQGLLVAAELGEAPALRVEGDGRALTVARRTERLQRLARVRERLAVTALPLGPPGDLEMGPRLTVVMAELTVQRQAVPQVAARVVVAAEPQAGAPDVAVRVRLPGPVGQAPRGHQRGALRPCPVVPVPLPVEEVPHGP